MNENFVTPFPVRPTNHWKLVAKLIAMTPAMLLLASCAVGPDYKRPDAPTSTAFKEQGDWKTAAPNDQSPRGKWWEVFQDKLLNDLMEQIDVSNQTLKASEAKYRQALALTDGTRAGLFPTLSVSESSTRSRTSQSRSVTGQNAVANSHSLTGSASWEIDLWGSIRRQIEVNDTSAQASQSDLESARLSLQTQLATNYFQLRVTDAQKKMYDETITAYDRSLTLTRNRYNQGIAGKVDVVQAETQLKSAQAQAIDLGAQRAQVEHAIAVLIGKPPSAFSLPTTVWNGVLPKFPVGLPSTLLERRPDIAAAERRAASANAQIGVARAAFFPALNLTGSDGYSSPLWQRLVSSPNQLWSLGASLSLSVIDFGRRSATSNQAIAGYDQAVANYRATVLGAFQDVEDNLASLRVLEAEAKVQDEAVRAARESVDLTTNQYKAGIVSYLNVVTVQTSLLTNERTSVGLLGRQLASTIGLIKALGGAW